MQFTVFAGIDWANSEHQIFAADADGEVLFEGRIPHHAEDLFAACDKLIAAAGGDPQQVAVSIERPHGLVVEALLGRNIRVFSINPKQLDRFRDRFSPSGAKDDRRDALCLCSSLRTDMRAFREVEPTAPVVIELSEWTRMRAEEQRERTRLTNRLREQLLRYFPQFLEVVNEPSKPWAIDLLRKVPTPSRASEVDLRTIAPILKKHRIRKHSPKVVLDILRSDPFTVAECVVTAATAHIEHLCSRIEVLNTQLKDCDRRIGKLLAQLEENEHLLSGAPAPTVPASEAEPKLSTARILNSMPGIGPVVLGTLLGEASQLLVAGNFAGLRLLSGIAPVTKSSGRSCYVVRRLASNNRLRDAFHHMAATGMQHDPRFRKRYRALRERGHSHGRALRQLADTMLRIIAAMLRDRTLYQALPTAS